MPEERSLPVACSVAIERTTFPRNRRAAACCVQAMYSRSPRVRRSSCLIRLHSWRWWSRNARRAARLRFSFRRTIHLAMSNFSFMVLFSDQREFLA